MKRKFVELKHISEIFLLLVIVVFFLSLSCEENIVEDNNQLCISDKPSEDTTRVYIWPTKEKKDTLLIDPDLVFARFYPWVKDSQIKQTTEKYGLRILGVGNKEALLSVPREKRAEHYFTPYGKEGYCNFGADSLVEYSFGVFYVNNIGRVEPRGDIYFKFIDGTSQEKIDSLFIASGLRFINTSRDDQSGLWYYAKITRKAKKNILDLGYDLQFVPFAQQVIVGGLGGGTLAKYR